MKVSERKTCINYKKKGKNNRAKNNIIETNNFAQLRSPVINQHDQNLKTTSHATKCRYLNILAPKA